MSDVEKRFHETWLGMVQPVDGLVLSVPVLVDAQCMQRQPPDTQQRLLELCWPAPEDDTALRIRDLQDLFTHLLGLTPDLFDRGDALPDDLALYVPEGRQTLRPTMALRTLEPPPEPDTDPARTDAARVGAPYVALVWELPDDLPLDKPETVTGPWDYPPSAKLDRLLRHVRVPIGLLTNGRVVRLVYAPHGESTGALTFRLDDMATVGGRPILDAFVMLLSATRFFGVAPEHQLPQLLAESRKRQANVTNALAAQVFEALETLLAGFEAAAERDGAEHLRDALERDDDHLYGGLLTVLLRLVFLLYAEDRGLLPVDHDHYAEHLSLLALFERLQDDAGAYPDSMAHRSGAWGQLLTLFRAVYLGVDHGDLHMPPRRGDLFDPHRFPFLEGWGPAGSAPITQPEARASVRVPSLDDATVHRVLEKLVLFEGQRLSYRTLDVEQIGSVYEALMGYHVVRVASPAVCMRPNRVWVTPDEVLGHKSSTQLAKWLKQTTGMANAQAKKLAEQVQALTKSAEQKPGGAVIIGDTLREQTLAALETYRVKGTDRARPLRLVIQPGTERRRTSSHYTPRSLSAPIVRRTLEPLLACMGDAPPSDRILNLKVCDPAMGSGAFLVEACRYLADQLVAAWTREGKLPEIAEVAPNEDPVMHARRLVAQRCLYGVDKNPFAVSLAKLSLWLVTLAKDLPFTFLDHALRHGDSLVGLTFDQIRAFHWKPKKQLELSAGELDAALTEAVELRQQIEKLAADPSPEAQREKERLLFDAEDALDRARLLGDLVVGAFFAEPKDKARDKERTRRLDMVAAWLDQGGPPPEDLRALQADLRARIPVFHWMLEFPEVFYAERPDPLDHDQVNRAAHMDAFVGNPPFAGKNGISELGGPGYLDWLQAVHQGAHGNADLSAHFFLRAAALLGAHGTIGLIATNTIAQGDTRATALQPLVAKRGFTIYDATRSMMWPGDAAVSVSVVHLAKGQPSSAVAPLILDRAPAEAINSRLRGKPERPDPVKLPENAGLSFQGSIVLGMGFVLTPEEREELIAKNPKNAERIFPYIGGEEVNTSPTQSPHRYVINFGQMSLEEAGQWPDLLEIVRERVKPERDQNKRQTYRDRWWRFAEYRPGLFEAKAPLERCLVAARTSLHVMFSFQPSERVFSENLVVIASENTATFAVLQSRVHAAWVSLTSSTLETRQGYRPSDCFETFAFPEPDPRALIPALEDIGSRLHEARAAYMRETQQGLTQTYNLLKNPDCHDAPIETLRALHEQVDRAVLSAYGWTDLEVPPYCPHAPADHQALETFQDEVIDRLFILNAERTRKA